MTVLELANTTPGTLLYHSDDPEASFLFECASVYQPKGTAPGADPCLYYLTSALTGYSIRVRGVETMLLFVDQDDARACGLSRAIERAEAELFKLRSQLPVGA